MSNQENFENREKNRKKKRWMLALLILLLLLLITSCSVTIWSLFFRDTPTSLAPDYAPQEIEPNATPTPDTDKDKLEQEQGGGSVSIQYTKEVRADLSDGMVYLTFANPGESNQDMVLQVIIQGKVIAQSKLLPPGHSLSQLPLLEGANLSPGGYDGKFTTAYYYENGERAIIQTDIPLMIRVEE